MAKSTCRVHSGHGHASVILAHWLKAHHNDSPISSLVCQLGNRFKVYVLWQACQTQRWAGNGSVSREFLAKMVEIRVHAQATVIWATARRTIRLLCFKSLVSSSPQTDWRRLMDTMIATPELPTHLSRTESQISSIERRRNVEGALQRHLDVLFTCVEESLPSTGALLSVLLIGVYMHSLPQ
jgi:hypothetical protein